MLIGLSGRKRNGKTAAAEHLIAKHDFHEVSWAFPLKEIIGKELLGLSQDQLYGKTEDKETVDPRWGKSPRELLQLVGTDCFREIIHPDFWVIVGMERIKKLMDKGLDIVVSDCRFPNELEAIKKLGGFTIRVVRKGYVGDDDQHPSETALDDVKHDRTTYAGDLTELFLSMNKLISDFRARIR